MGEVQTIKKGKVQSVARGDYKAYATPWEVCFNVAYPPDENVGRSGEGGLTHGVPEVVCRASCLVVTF